MMVGKLNAADQAKAQQLRAEPKPAIYWLKPEYNSIEAIMKLCELPMYEEVQSEIPDHMLS